MTCKNCKQSLSVEDNFCNACGAKVINHRLTLKYLFSEFYDRFVSLDNSAFFRTFISLYTKPKEVIDGYINGVRKRFINVAGYIAIAITLSGFQFYVAQKLFPENIDYDSFGVAPKEFMQSWMTYVSDYQSILYLLFIPFYALVSKLVFLKRKKYNYTEHIVIMGYTQAQISITFTLPIIISAAFGVDITNFYIFVMIIYNAYCLKSLFELNKTQIILKTLLFFGLLILISLMLIIAIYVFVFAYVHLTGNKIPFSPEAVETMSFVTQYSL